MSNKCTLIVDGNWLLMSRLGPMLPQFSTSLPEETKQSAQDGLVDFVAQSIAMCLQRLKPAVDNVIIVKDGGSWRKQLMVPKMNKDATYKGNRKKATDTDWTYVFGALDVLCRKFKENNLTCVCDHNIEGDDWVWFWSRMLNNRGTNCVIWTSDVDLQQLVQSDSEHHSWTAWLNDRAGLMLPKSLDDSGSDDEFLERAFTFSCNESDDPCLQQLIGVCRNYTKVDYIEPNDIILSKIICGDTSDNIKPICHIKTDEMKKAVQLSKKDWEKIQKAYEINNVADLKHFENEVTSSVFCLNKFRGKEGIKPQDILEMMHYNKRLVWLDKTSYPEEVKNTMIAHKNDYTQCDTDTIINNYKVLTDEKEDIDEFMEGLV